VLTRTASYAEPSFLAAEERFFAKGLLLCQKMRIFADNNNLTNNREYGLDAHRSRRAAHHFRRGHLQEQDQGVKRQKTPCGPNFTRIYFAVLEIMCIFACT
jgi:hypothetical protein